MNINALLASHKLLSDQISSSELGVVLEKLDTVLSNNIPGDIVEFGCYIGTTSHFIRRLLDAHHQSNTRAFHVYDSFEGLPPKSQQDSNAAGEAFRAGELAISKKRFLATFQKAGLTPPITHKAWFDTLTPQDVPNQIAFAFLDGDFYDSIRTSLTLVWPQLSKGGVVVIHDYKRAELPGVERAVQDFFKDKPAPKLRVERGIGILLA